MIEWLAIAYWVALFVFTAASLVLAALSWMTRSLWLIAAAAAALTVGLIVAALPGPGSVPILAVLISVLGVGVGVVGGAPAATATLRLATQGSVPNGVHGGILIESERREVLRGGLTIGLLERLAIVTTIIAGMPAALAVIVAVKGVGRFSELEAPEARERFIIGTFASLIWAGACGALVVLALN